MVAGFLSCSVAESSNPATEQPSNLLSPPSRASGRVLHNDSAREQLVPNAVRLREIARASGRVARLDQSLDARVERVIALGKDVENRIDLHQGSLQALGVAGGDPAGIDGAVRVADEREARTERAGGIQIVNHGLLEIGQEAADELIGVP